MKPKTLLTIVFFLLEYSLFAQGLLKLSVDVYKSYDELKGAYENLNKVQSIVKDIESGGKPNINSYGSDWSALANNYKIAAETIKKSKMVTDFDASLYSISISDLNNCYNKDQNFNKLRNYKSQLDSAITKGQSELTKIIEYKNLIEQTFTALKYLIDVNAKLSSVPIYNQIFQWNWFDLETGVRPALGELSSAINIHEKKLKQEVENVKIQSSNLSSNTALLENSICLVTGAYANDCSLNGWEARLTLTIRKVGTIYSANFTASNKRGSSEIPISNFQILNNRFIEFDAKGTNSVAHWTGELSSDFKKIMNFYIPKGHRNTCTLSK